MRCRLFPLPEVKYTCFNHDKHSMMSTGGSVYQTLELSKVPFYSSNYKRESIEYYLCIISFEFPVPVCSYNCCWFFGQDFCMSSFEQYFQARAHSKYNGYIKHHFDTRGFFSNSFNENPSPVGHLSNLMAQAIECIIDRKLLPLPKIIVVVPDGDLIKCFEECSEGLAKPLSRVVNHVMTEHSRCISSFKDYLPAKCIRPDHPKNTLGPGTCS